MNSQPTPGPRPDRRGFVCVMVVLVLAKAVTGEVRARSVRPTGLGSQWPHDWRSRKVSAEANFATQTCRP